MTTRADLIDQRILNGERIQEIFDLRQELDLLIVQRMAFFRYEVPLMVGKGVASLSLDDRNNCFIDTYLELKSQGRIHLP